VISVVDRVSLGTTATVRGTVVSGPRLDGEVLYVDDQEPPHLRSTTRAALVRDLPSASAWSGHPLAGGGDLVAVLGQSATEVQAWILRREDGATVAHRVLSLDSSDLVASTTHPFVRRLYISTRAKGGGGAFVALDDTLMERWRTSWPNGHLFDAYPSICVTGDGARLVAAAPSGLLSIDAYDGSGSHMFPIVGEPIRAFAPMPGRAPLAVLRVHARAPETPSYQIVLVDARSGAHVTLRSGAGAYPAALVFAGATLLVAAP
jgi:hypothetical protein